jgi:AcrR family transcriptional regulator
MASPRRERAATAEKRERLLDATEELMLQDGYAAVSSRSVATKVGINAPLLHYYFPTLDDLFVAVVRRRGESTLRRMAGALDSEEPLRAWWRLASDPRGSALLVELIAASNHRAPLRAAVGELARDLRHMQMGKLSSLLDEYGLDPVELPPALVSAAIQGLAFALVADHVAGYETSTSEAQAGMEQLIDRLEERRRSRRSKPDR